MNSWLEASVVLAVTYTVLSSWEAWPLGVLRMCSCIASATAPHQLHGPWGGMETEIRHNMQDFIPFGFCHDAQKHAWPISTIKLKDRRLEQNTERTPCRHEPCKPGGFGSMFKHDKGFGIKLASNVMNTGSRKIGESRCYPGRVR